MGEDYILTDRGFLVTPGFSGETLDTFYETLVTRGNGETIPWDDKVKGIKLAKGVFGPSLNAWIVSQSKGGYLTGRRLEFVLDTLYFIQTGKRKVSASNWYELLEDYPKPEPFSLGAREFKSLQKFETLLTDRDFIAQWCSHKNGFEDMICTLSAIAGGHRKTDVPPERSRGRLTVRPL